MKNLTIECMRAEETLIGFSFDEQRFPHKVFPSSWREFYFFDPDYMFDPSFAEIVKSFLDVEKSTCACMVRLDSEEYDLNGDSKFYFSEKTGPENYQMILSGAESRVGWIHDMGRFSCCSEVGGWCIYCERNNEVAALAFDGNSKIEPFMSVVDSLKAVRIAEVIEKTLLYGFSTNAMSDEWRAKFLFEYASQG